MAEQSVAGDHHVVTDEQHRTITSKVLEIQSQLARKKGSSLNPGQVAIALSGVAETLQDIVEGKFPLPKPENGDGVTHASLVRDLLFCSAEQQIENVRRWNIEQKWGAFGENDFEKAKSSIPKDWPQQPLGAHVLVPYCSNDLLESFLRMVDLFAHTKDDAKKEAKKDRHLFSPGEQWLDLLPKKRKKQSCRLCWESIDLGALIDDRRAIVSDIEYKKARTFPDIGIMAAALHFPGWINAMRGTSDHIPLALLPGLQVEFKKDFLRIKGEPHIFNLFICSGGQKPSIAINMASDSGNIGLRVRRYAIPMFI